MQVPVLNCMLTCHVRIWNPLQSLKLQISRALVLGKEFLDIQATIECGFNLKCVRDMIITYNQMHRTYKYSQHSSIICPVWPNGWVFLYKLSGCGFESHCSHQFCRQSKRNVTKRSGCRWLNIGLILVGMNYFSDLDKLHGLQN